MTLTARLFEDYNAALLLFAEEEISGEAYFARLASFHSGRQSHALLLLARMESVVASAARTLLVRHGLATADASALRGAGQAEADAKAGTPWRDLVAEMTADFPAFVEEFEQVERLAPADERAVVRIFTKHEVAALEFARLEAGGNVDSLAPLERFLAEHG